MALAWVCYECGHIASSEDDVCPKCGGDLLPVPTKIAAGLYRAGWLAARDAADEVCRPHEEAHKAAWQEAIERGDLETAKDHLTKGSIVRTILAGIRRLTPPEEVPGG
jgi:hypothetical protein